ncbi:MAG: hypothetical protein ACI4RV_01205 [Eubacteriales bacterium]
MSRRFQVGHRAGKAPHTAATPSGGSKAVKDAAIGKGRIVALPVLLTAVVAGIYVAAVKLCFEPIFHLYWITSGVLVCAAALLQRRNEYLYTKETQEGDREQAAASYAKRKRQIKYLLIVLIPFLLTVFADAVYLIFLADLDLFQALSSLGGAK